MKKLGPVFVSLTVVSFFLTFYFTSYAQAETGRHSRVLITQSINESKTVVLHGNTRGEATPDNDRGRVADDFPMEHMLLQLHRPAEQEKALQQFIEELHNPGSANFHNWLTPPQFGESFGLSQQDLDTVTGWLRSQGFSVNVIYPSGMLIDFSGTAGQVRKTFHTEIHHLEVNGVGHIANMRDPEIPAALSPAIVGVVSLHDFRPHTMHKMSSEYTFSSGGYPYQAVTPADLATIYNLNPLFGAGISGQGQTIVVIEDSNVYNTADWNKFRSTFGLSSYSSGSFTQVHPAPPSGSNNCSSPGANSDDDEAIFDAEYASAAAPSAAIELASCANTITWGGLISLQNLINSTTPPAIISVSYGACEAEIGATANAAFYAIYQQAVSEGVSVFVAAGDEGAASCDAGQTAATHGIGVSGFASTPYNVAVGGTDFSDTYTGTNSIYWNPTNSSSYGSALSYIPEIPWNDSCASVLLATSFGYSTTYGSSGFCNSFLASSNKLLTTTSGSGGPSGCATGFPSFSSPGVVSGSCAGYPKPSWQSIIGNPGDGVRDVPDVSLFAGNGVWGHYYIFCNSDTANGGVACTGAPSGWSGAGGTSFGAPIMAGIQALANQKVAARQGNPNFVYYSLAAAEYGQSGNGSCNSSLGNFVNNSCIFYDITQGDIDVNCTGRNNCYIPSGTHGILSTSDNSYYIAYVATTGWDFATGIGTVNAYNLVNSWPLPPTVPGPPTGVTAAAGNAQAIVSFTAPASDGGSTITSYTVTSNPSNITATGSSSPITVTSLTNGTSYTFTVTATNSVGTGPSSNSSPSVTPATVPGPPASVSAETGNAQSTVSFTPPASDGGSQITSYTVTSNPANITAAGSSSPLTVTGLTNGTAYTFTVTAINAMGTGSASGPSNSVTPTADLIRIESAPMVSYSAIEQAYTNAASTDVMEILVTTFNDSPDFNLSKTITLKGGFDSSFASQTGYSAIAGSLTISTGAITVDHLIIQ